MFKLLRNASALTAIRAGTMLAVLYIASWQMETGVLYWGIILAIFGSIVQITSLNLNHSMAVVFVRWNDSVQKSAVSKIVLFRMIFGVGLFIYGIGSDALIGLDLIGHWLLFFGVLFRLVFDSLYGYARAIIRQDVMGLMTILESLVLLGGLFLASTYSSTSIDFKIFTIIVLATYLSGSVLGLTWLLSASQSLPNSVKVGLEWANIKTLIFTGVSIYPIACIDMLWLSGTVFLLLHLGQIELIPFYVLLQRLCTVIALGYSIPNSVLSQIIARPGIENKLLIVVIGLMSIIFSGLLVGILVIFFIEQIAGFFNVNSDLLMHRQALLYVLGYCLVLAVGLCSSVILSMGYNTIVFLGGLVFWMAFVSSMVFIDSYSTLSMQSFFGVIAANIFILIVAMSCFIYKLGLHK